MARQFPYVMQLRLSPAQHRAIEIVADSLEVAEAEAARMFISQAASSAPWLVDQLEDEGTPIVIEDPVDYVASKVRAGEAVVS